MDSPLELSGKVPCWHLDFHPVTPCWRLPAAPKLYTPCVQVMSAMLPFARSCCGPILQMSKHVESRSISTLSMAHERNLGPALRGLCLPDSTVLFSPFHAAHLMDNLIFLQRSTDRSLTPLTTKRGRGKAAPLKP